MCEQKRNRTSGLIYLQLVSSFLIHYYRSERKRILNRHTGEKERSLFSSSPYLCLVARHETSSGGSRSRQESTIITRLVSVFIFFTWYYCWPAFSQWAFSAGHDSKRKRSNKRHLKKDQTDCVYTHREPWLFHLNNA